MNSKWQEQSISNICIGNGYFSITYWFLMGKVVILHGNTFTYCNFSVNKCWFLMINLAVKVKFIINLTFMQLQYNLQLGLKLSGISILLWKRFYWEHSATIYQIKDDPVTI